MANITAQMVKDLREETSAGMMDCKAALTETGGDFQAAVDWLRKKGLSKAAKKAGRVAAEGMIGAVTKGTKGVVVEVNSETDFVARNEQFQGLVKMIAQVALRVGADVEAIKAAKKAGRVAAEGLIGVAVKGTKGVVVEINSETDFVARNDLFQGLVKMIANVAIDVGPDVERI